MQYGLAIKMDFMVYLYKQGIFLPQNSVQLYNYFIFLSVFWHLAKYGHHLQSNITIKLQVKWGLDDFYNPVL